MWANPWGGSWPIQQSTVQNMRHDQVDWATLAKQWIAQREAAEVLQQEEHSHLLENLAQKPPPPPAPPEPAEGAYSEGQPGSLQQDDNSMDISDEEAEAAAKSSTSAKNGLAGQGALLPTPVAPSHQGVGGEWETSWPPPSQGPEAWSEDGSQDGFNYNQGPGFGAKFPPSGDMFFQTQGGGPQMLGNLQQQQLWPPQGAGGPPLGIGPPGFPPQIPFPPGPSPTGDRHPSRSRHYQGDAYPAGRADDSGIDSAKRKQLPAWIREGLEKMEREKQKQAEKEKMEQEKQEAQRAKEAAEKEAAEELRREQEESATGEARLPRKSRFDSDDEEDGEQSRTASPAPKDLVSSPDTKKRSPSPEQFRTEEEKQLELMMKVKQWMTEILLDVTSSMISEVAHQVYDKAKVQALKAPAKVLAKSSALASITSLGLGYGSGSSDEESAGSEDSDSESSDQEVKKSARVKTEDKDKIFSDDDSDYKAEPTVPEYLKNPLSETSKSFSFSKEEEAIPGIDNDQQEGKGQIKVKGGREPKDMSTDKVKRERRISQGQSESKKSKSTVKVKKEDSTESSLSSSESSSGSSSSSSSESSSSQESDSNSGSKKKKKVSKQDGSGGKSIREAGSGEWVEKTSGRKRREGSEDEKGERRESGDREKRKGGEVVDGDRGKRREGSDSEKRKADKKKQREKEKPREKKRRRGHSEERGISRDREQVRDRSRSLDRDRLRKRQQSVSDEVDSESSRSRNRDEGGEHRRYVSSSPEVRRSRSRDREKRRKASISREREVRGRRSTSREKDRYDSYDRASRSGSRDSYYDSRRRSRDRDRRSRSRSNEERRRRGKHPKHTESKSKSRKRRRSGSSGSERGGRRRTSKESSSTKHRSHRDNRHDEGYERSGKKSRKHKSRSRSRSSSLRRR